MTDVDPLCADRCAYGTCSDPGKSHGPYGCGSCCGCRGGCEVTWDREQAEHFRTEHERRHPTLAELETRRNA